jgi:hypothetical protein
MTDVVCIYIYICNRIVNVIASTGPNFEYSKFAAELENSVELDAP